MQYNTQQKRMPLRDFSGCILNMVELGLTLEDPCERERCGYTIINMM